MPLDWRYIQNILLTSIQIITWSLIFIKQILRFGFVACMAIFVSTNFTRGCHFAETQVLPIKGLPSCYQIFDSHLFLRYIYAVVVQCQVLFTRKKLVWYWCYWMPLSRPLHVYQYGITSIQVWNFRYTNMELPFIEVWHYIQQDITFFPSIGFVLNYPLW